MKDKEVPYESDTRRALKKLREAAKTDRFEEVEQQIAAIGLDAPGRHGDQS